MKSITSITDVYGDGQKVKAISIEFENKVLSSSLSIDTFSVDERNITDVFTSSDERGKHPTKNGKYIYIVLNINDPKSYTFIKEKHKPPLRLETQLNLKVLKDFKFVNGEDFKKSEIIHHNTKEINITFDDFKQFKFEKEGCELKYNLFSPKSISKNEKYPLVLFMHDAGTVGNDAYITLIQGNGATVWASEEEQIKRKCYVLAPQFSTILVNDDSETFGQYDLIMPMIQEVICNNPAIDQNRIYTTGQSMGCMASIALMIEYKHFFAAALLIAGQWSATKMKALSNDTFWIIVSAGDEKASNGMNESMSAIESLGVNITRATWNGQSTSIDFSEEVSKVISHETQINYITFANGTVVPPNEPLINNHMGTWKIAYNIEGVRSWIFEQKKSK